MKKVILFLPILLLLAGCENVDCTGNDCVEPVCGPSDYICLYENGAIDDFSDIKISELGNMVLKTLSDGDMNSFSQYISSSGVKFSAYGYFVDEDIVLTRDDLNGNRGDVKIRGNYDGSGEPIELSIKDYFDRFVYNHEFLSAPEINEGTILGRGNSLINVNDYYDNSQAIEYHFPGFDPEYGGMDWESLILIFDKNTHYLIGVAHEERTV